MKIRAVALALALVLAAQAAPAPATAAALRRHVIAACAARGPNAACTAGDQDPDDWMASPSDIRVHVRSAIPGQRVDVSWAGWCDTPDGFTLLAGGLSLSARTPVRALVWEPPGAYLCSVTAWARLENRHSRWVGMQVTYWS